MPTKDCIQKMANLKKRRLRNVEIMKTTKNSRILQRGSNLREIYELKLKKLRFNNRCLAKTLAEERQNSKALYDEALNLKIELQDSQERLNNLQGEEFETAVNLELNRRLKDQCGPLRIAIEDAMESFINAVDKLSTARACLGHLMNSCGKLSLSRSRNSSKFGRSLSGSLTPGSKSGTPKGLVLPMVDGHSIKPALVSIPKVNLKFLWKKRMNERKKGKNKDSSLKNYPTDYDPLEGPSHLYAENSILLTNTELSCGEKDEYSLALNAEMNAKTATCASQLTANSDDKYNQSKTSENNSIDFLPFEIVSSSEMSYLSSPGTMLNRLEELEDKRGRRSKSKKKSLAAKKSLNLHNENNENEAYLNLCDLPSFNGFNKCKNSTCIVDESMDMTQPVSDDFLHNLQNSDITNLQVTNKKGNFRHDRTKKFFRASINSDVIGKTSDGMHHVTEKTPFDLSLLEPTYLINQDLSINSEAVCIKDLSVSLERISVAKDVSPILDKFSLSEGSGGVARGRPKRASSTKVSYKEVNVNCKMRQDETKKKFKKDKRQK